jgi:hypothetical protein
MQVDLTINRINLDFRMAKQNYADEVLRAIAKEALDFLLKNVNANRIKCILVTGSIANGEGTVIKHNSSVITSDFDFVVYLDFPCYLKNRTHFRHLSQLISTRLINRKVNTHVVFLPSAKIFQTGIRFTNSNIYEYEFAFASKCVFGNSPLFDKNVRPSGKDALELVFTVASDIVFSELEHDSEIEKSYTYAKRALTLLNSLLIFQGVFAGTYAKRLEAAKEHVANGMSLLSKNELRVLELFTEYKLCGSLENLMASLGCTSLSTLIGLEQDFLKKLTVKAIFYELMFLTRDQKGQNLEHGVSYEKLSPIFASQLLSVYLKKSKVSSISRITGVTIYALAFFRKDRDRAELFATFVFSRQSPKAILNCIITMLLLHGQNLSAQILSKEFPWITKKGSAFRKVFSLWRIAEHSIKLG